MEGNTIVLARSLRFQSEWGEWTKQLKGREVDDFLAKPSVERVAFFGYFVTQVDNLQNEDV